MKKFKIIAIAILLSGGIFFSSINTQTYATATVSAPTAPVAQYTNVNALELVSNPYPREI